MGENVLLCTPCGVQKLFLITILGHDIGVVQDHLCSVSFFPQQLWGLPNIVSARRKRDINPHKNFSIFRTPAPGHAAIYSSRAHPSRTNNTKCVHISRAHQFFGNNFIQNCKWIISYVIGMLSEVIFIWPTLTKHILWLGLKSFSTNA